ncbi:MAG TPA: dTDP-4-dehydrorhamnose reductase [Candidatus Methylomirabilis sp.]|jgi:dTDP-4-dehydrorhamnose reductase
MRGDKDPIVITGAGGQLGCALLRAPGGLPFLPWSRTQADVTDPDIVSRLERVHPRAIVHAASWTDVDGCEMDPDRAARVNAEGTRRIAGAAAACGAHLVYLSTDYVFDGTKGAPYTEADPPNPINVYGRTKLEGEAHVRALCPRHTILRTAWLYGPGGRTFVQAIIERARQEDRIEVVTDQVGSPTLTDDLAGVIRQVLEKELLGLFHAAGEGSCSRYDLARAIVGVIRPGVKVVPVETVPGARPARRPPNAALATGSLRAAGIPLRPWHDALTAFLAAAPASRALP